MLVDLGLLSNYLHNVSRFQFDIIDFLSQVIEILVLYFLLANIPVVPSTDLISPHVGYVLSCALFI